MPHLTHKAAARRDSQLLRIRKLSLWITGGAAAVSLGLGTAFAHALPGHSHPAAPAGAQTGTRASGAAPPATSARPAVEAGQRAAPAAPAGAAIAPARARPRPGPGARPSQSCSGGS